MLQSDHANLTREVLALHNHDHYTPVLQIQTEILPCQNCPFFEGKALVKEICFH